MTVREVLAAAREAALEIRRIEEQTELRRLAIGVQGHGYDVHSKSGILDPTRKIDELIQWELDLVDKDELRDPIEEALELVSGAERTDSGPLAIETVTRYYLQAESYVEIARDLADVRKIEALQGMTRKLQIKVLSGTMDAAIGEWERLGIAKLKELAHDA